MNEELVNMQFTNDIDDDIFLLKGKCESFGELTDFINAKYNKDIPIHKIGYRAQKYLEKSYGIPEDDAFNFFESAEEEVEKRGGFFHIEIKPCGEFKIAIYMSSTMLTYAKNFLDIVLVDATYKRNSFNLPL